MIEIAENVFQIPLFPRNAINAYLIGSVLIDAGVRLSGKRILKAIGNREITAHALTHAHGDHQGASAFVCKTLNVPFWCSEGDQSIAESGLVSAEFPNPNSLIARFQQRYFAGDGYPVAKTLKEGDMVADFQVIETPGHSPGHIAFWRERDGILIAGDVVVNMNLITTMVGLDEPPSIFTADIGMNRQSIKKIAALEPRIVCVGHGPPLTNIEALQRLASRW